MFQARGRKAHLSKLLDTWESRRTAALRTGEEQQIIEEIKKKVQEMGQEFSMASDLFDKAMEKMESYRSENQDIVKSTEFQRLQGMISVDKEESE